MSEEHAEHHILPVSLYVTIFGALMVLTLLTVGVAFLNVGWMNNVVMVGIAMFKAFLVVTIFMHLKYGAKILWIVAGGSVIWLIILLSLTLSDVLSRDWQIMQPASWL